MNDRSADSHHHPVTKGDALLDSGARTDMSRYADPHSAAKDGAGTDVSEVPDMCVVLDNCPGVDDGATTERCQGLNNPTGEHLASRP